MGTDCFSHCDIHDVAVFFMHFLCKKFAEQKKIATFALLCKGRKRYYFYTIGMSCLGEWRGKKAEILWQNSKLVRYSFGIGYLDIFHLMN